MDNHFHINLQIILFSETVDRIDNVRAVVPEYLFSQSAFQRKDLTFLIHCHLAFRYHHQCYVPLPPFPFPPLPCTSSLHCNSDPNKSFTSQQLLSIIATQIWYFYCLFSFFSFSWVWCNWLVLS